MGGLITLNDKQFKPFISQQQLSDAVQKIAGLIHEDFKTESPFFLVVLNGAFMFASDLMKEIKIPCEISFVKTSSYSGTSSSGNIEFLIGLNENVKGKSVVIVEDIVETGLTIDKLIIELKLKKVKQIKIATILMKPEAYKLSHTIDYPGIHIGKDFVVGYGLDYNGLGRNLKEIHVLA